MLGCTSSGVAAIGSSIIVESATASTYYSADPISADTTSSPIAETGMETSSPGTVAYSSAVTPSTAIASSPTVSSTTGASS